MCERNYTSKEKKIIDNFKLNNPRICTYCNKPISNTDVVTVDHKIPICKGGETANENLAISCLVCNHEKDDMTFEEYTIFKQKQKETLDNYEVNNVFDYLISTYNNIISRIKEIDDEYTEIDKQIIKLQQDIMWSNFNACEGYLFTKKLNELLLRKEELRILKIGFTQLHTQIGRHRKEIVDTKNRVQVEVKNANKMYLKRYATDMCRKKGKSKVVYLEQGCEVAK